MINKVTITGADDSISPVDLLRLSQKYPFVEWGILFSPKRSGTNRYPSQDWLNNLYLLKDKLNLSAHLCGDYSKELVEKRELEFLFKIFHNFSRFQINYSFREKEKDDSLLRYIISSNKNNDFIIQANSNNLKVCYELSILKLENLNFLYDASCGRGTKIDFLGMPFDHNYTGYAGGISPENIESEIQRINEFVGEIPTWIDMETHVRSNDDTLFDLQKVEKCLQIAANYIVPENSWQAEAFQQTVYDLHMLGYLTYKQLQEITAKHTESISQNILQCFIDYRKNKN